MLLKEIMHYLAKEIMFFPYKVKYYACALISSYRKCIKHLPCSAHPEVYWVKIDDIKYNGYIEISKQSGQFCSGGTWEFPEKHIRMSAHIDVPRETYRWSIHKTVRMIFVENKSYQETPQYMGIMEKLDASIDNKAIWGCRTKEDVDALFEEMIVVYDNMRKNGYKAQTELGKHNRDEMQIYITEDGSLLKGIGGNHRIVMAELLGIKMVPIVIHGAHRKFVKNLSEKWNLPPHKVVEKWIQENEFIHTHRQEPQGVFVDKAWN